MNLTDKLYILYAELTSIENAFEQKKKIDFALELNSDINYRKKIIEKTNNYFYNKIIDAIKKIETNNYSSEKFTKTLFKKIIDIDFYKSKIDSIDLDEFYKLGEKYESESELIQKAKKQFNIEFLIQYFEIIQLLNSYDFYTNKIPKKDKITSFNRDLIKGIACLQEKLDLNELERIFKDTKSESFFIDYISF